MSFNYCPKNPGQICQCPEKKPKSILRSEARARHHETMQFIAQETSVVLDKKRGGEVPHYNPGGFIVLKYQQPM